MSRVVRYWDRPRLLAVDWLNTTSGAAEVRVPKRGQDDRYMIQPGAPVMLAGDGDPDVHAVVVRDEGDYWVVEPAWDVWDQ